MAILDRVPRLEDFGSPVRNPRLTARLGLWLGGALLALAVVTILTVPLLVTGGLRT